MGWWQGGILIGWWGPKQFLPSSAWPAEMFGAYAKIMGEQHHEASPVTNSTWNIGELRMAASNLNRRTLMSLLPVSIFGLASCASGQSSDVPRLETDAQFQEMVLRRMPDYRLTSSITGRAVVRSPGFSLLVINNRDSPQTVIRDFLAQFENTGLRAVDLYFDQFNSYEDAWRVVFPGCRPGECASVAQDLTLERVAEEVHDRYVASRTSLGFVRHQIAAETISRVAYQAEVVVGYDYRGRVIAYSVVTNRVPVNDAERKWVARNARSQFSHPVHVYRYVHNLALGVSEFYDNGPSIRGNSSRGL